MWHHIMHGSLLRWDGLNHKTAEDVIVADMQSSLAQILHLALQAMVSAKVVTDTGCCTVKGLHQ